MFIIIVEYFCPCFGGEYNTKCMYVEESECIFSYDPRYGTLSHITDVKLEKLKIQIIPRHKVLLFPGKTILSNYEDSRCIHVLDACEEKTLLVDESDSRKNTFPTTYMWQISSYLPGKSKIIAVDVDETLIHLEEGKYEAALPIEDMKQKLQDEHKDDDIVIAWTSRGFFSNKSWKLFTYNQLTSFGIKVNGVVDHKMYYDKIIDDKAEFCSAIHAHDTSLPG